MKEPKEPRYPLMKAEGVEIKIPYWMLREIMSYASHYQDLKADKIFGKLSKSNAEKRGGWFADNVKLIEKHGNEAALAEDCKPFFVEAYMRMWYWHFDAIAKKELQRGKEDGR